MGIYDRDYIRDDRPSSGFASWSMVTKLIVINVAVWVLDVYFNRALSDNFALKGNVLTHPWELLTYGFLHDPKSPGHIFFNMLVLWMFGRDVERVYGPKEFLRIYLSFVISVGLAWALIGWVAPNKAGPMFGASGAIMGIVALFIMHFPHQQVLYMFVIPMPVWVLGIIFILSDVFGYLNPKDDHIAHAAHLAGVFFGALYAQTGWCLASLIPQKWSLPKFRRRTKLRVHREQDDGPDEPVTQQRVDELLAKISREGESSLTDKERRELEEASRRYRGHQRRQ